MFHLHFCFRNKYWRFYLLTCTTCIVYQYFKELVASVSKAGAKVRGLFLTTKLFRKFFFIFSFLLISQTLLRKGKNNHKRKSKTALFANRTAKIKTFIYMFQTFSELFCFYHQAALRFVTKSFVKAFFSWKAGAKVVPFGYTPNISGSFFEVFLKDFAKVLKENDVVEHIFFIIKGLGQKR